MRSRFDSFGIGQNVKRQWMDKALDLAVAGTPVAECRRILMCHVLDGNTKTGPRGAESAKKVVSILGAWFAPGKDLQVFSSQLLGWAKECPVEEICGLHWAVIMAAYPFFMEMAKIMGRLLALQTKFSKSQVLKRCEELRGVTPTAARNLEYALWIMVDMGMLKHGDEHGCYERVELPIAVSERTAMLLWKSVLHATRGGKLSATALRNSPAFFPFAMPMIFPSQFRDAFDDIDTTQYIGVEEQIFLKEGQR